jgi:hypothetical protein
MLGQLDRLHVIAELPNVALGILPFGEVPVWRSHHFALYDEREDGALVHVEQLGGESNYRDPEDVALHAEAFKRLLDLAAVGPDALAILDRLAADLR